MVCLSVRHADIIGSTKCSISSPNSPRNRHETFAVPRMAIAGSSIQSWLHAWECAGVTTSVPLMNESGPLREPCAERVKVHSFLPKDPMKWSAKSSTNTSTSCSSDRVLTNSRMSQVNSDQRGKTSLWVFLVRRETPDRFKPSMNLFFVLPCELRAKLFNQMRRSFLEPHPVGKTL